MSRTSSSLTVVARAAPDLHRSGNLPDVLQFMQVLWAMVHALDSASKRMAQQLGVTGPQRLVLRVVGLFPGLSAGDLAAVLHMHPSTLTGIIQRLIAQRLLQRLEDPQDRRRAVLRLTARGVQVNDTNTGTIESAIAAALEGLGARDRMATRRVLERLTARLEPGVFDSLARRSLRPGRR